MKYDLILTTKFKKDYKRIKKRGYDLTLLQSIVDELLLGNPLDKKYKDHILKGTFNSKHECHIKPDWLLIYEISEITSSLTLISTGTHADLLEI